MNLDAARRRQTWTTVDDRPSATGDVDDMAIWRNRARRLASGERDADQVADTAIPPTSTTSSTASLPSPRSISPRSIIPSVFPQVHRLPVFTYTCRRRRRRHCHNDTIQVPGWAVMLQKPIARSKTQDSRIRPAAVVARRPCTPITSPRIHDHAFCPTSWLLLRGAGYHHRGVTVPGAVLCQCPGPASGCCQRQQLGLSISPMASHERVCFGCALALKRPPVGHRASRPHTRTFRYTLEQKQEQQLALDHWATATTSTTTMPLVPSSRSSMPTVQASSRPIGNIHPYRPLIRESRALPRLRMCTLLSLQLLSLPLCL
ncbi:hypothetical protein C8Q73DRAFT_69459 [Cubamyces lactineus]|nr:hypothetical protein C8Q73DRAFT_69459 [Cubamyces lactineus]